MARIFEGKAASRAERARPIAGRQARQSPGRRLPQIIAIALTRLCSAVRSATNALSAEEIAPAPCNARPAMIHLISGAAADTALPSAKISNPAAITGLRPRRSDALP